jgi:hypothetical protein
MFTTMVGAGAASRYGSGSSSDQNMRLLAAPAPSPAPQHWLEYQSVTPKCVSAVLRTRSRIIFHAEL